MSAEDMLSSIEWAVAQRPFPGMDVSGDHCLVHPFGDGILLAVMDGLGHGPGADAASRLACDCLLHSQPARGLAQLIRDCHEALRGSRGVAMTLAIYQPGPGTLQWSSIGNVEAVLWHLPEEDDGRRLCVTPRGGVIGYQLPTPHVATLEVAAGDICCMATDGIASAFVERTPPRLEPRNLADYILERYGRGTDDALVLAVRFAGSKS